MATESIRITGLIPASPKEIYEAWLDSDSHSRFSGGKAAIEPKVGGKYTAWDGYISGKTVELVPNKKIVQTWRSTDFPGDAPDSRLEVLLAPRSDGAEITLLHDGIPEGQGHKYEEGWLDHYVTPMRAWFNARAARAAKAAEKAAEKAASKPPPAPKPKPVTKPAQTASKKSVKPAKKTAPSSKKSARAKKSKAAKAPAKKSKTAKKRGAR